LVAPDSPFKNSREEKSMLHFMAYYSSVFMQLAPILKTCFALKLMKTRTIS